MRVYLASGWGWSTSHSRDESIKIWSFACSANFGRSLIGNAMPGATPFNHHEAGWKRGRHSSSLPEISCAAPVPKRIF